MAKFSYPNDPTDAECPFCKGKQKPCSYVDSMTRAYARGACRRKFFPPKKEEEKDLGSSFKEWSQNNK